ncbi:MAG: acetyl-CoA carboxylase, carboxyltransferase subunit beta [Firmicutes bacterium]|nr:acetyl-CoA carboxylase, carboxyltransferase subunit beta [Bacillota bacterium]
MINIFKKKKYITLPPPKPPEAGGAAPSVPEGVWVKCAHCKKAVYKKNLDAFRICPFCGGYFRMNARERVAITADENTFSEFGWNIECKNPIGFPDYEKKLANERQKTGESDAVVAGTCEICGIKTVLCVMDSNFIMGSLGTVEGERLARSFDCAGANGLPVVVFTASGGARMQEGIMSLMQMAKVSAAVGEHGAKRLFYASVLTNPTTGGVTASFAMQGDVILAEPKALVGFAGPRVIEQTIGQSLPEGFQSAEFLLEHGFVDHIAGRREMKAALGSLLRMHGGGKGCCQ